MLSSIEESLILCMASLAPMLGLGIGLPCNHGCCCYTWQKRFST